MSWQDLHLEPFLDLLADMPDIEAVDEIDTRLQRIKDERDALGLTVAVIEARTALNLEEDQLRLRRHKLVFRIEQRKWSKAVLAVFGVEGRDRCLEWMRGLPEEDVRDIALRRSNEGGSRC
jgi:hypothetical protein